MLMHAFSSKGGGGGGGGLNFQGGRGDAKKFVTGPQR